MGTRIETNFLTSLLLIRDGTLPNLSILPNPTNSPIVTSDDYSTRTGSVFLVDLISGMQTFLVVCSSELVCQIVVSDAT